MNRRTVPVPTTAVWAVLADGRTYADWVVGTTDIREVDADFPTIGSRLHYTIGVGPLRHDGHTEVHHMGYGRYVEMEAHAWPAGTARIRIDLASVEDERCEIRIEEAPARGIGRLVHNPVSDLAIKVRNVTTLRRLERIATAVAGGQSPAGAAHR